MEELVIDGVVPDRIRLGVSELVEGLLSLKAVRRPGAYPAYTDLVIASRRAIDRIGRERLLALLGQRPGPTLNWVPDTFFVLPASPHEAFEDGLAAAAQSDPAQLWRELIEIHGAVPTALGRNPGAVLDAACSLLAAYWGTVVRPRWPTIGAVLDADIAFRARTMAGHGVGAMIGSLVPGMRHERGAVRLTLRHSSGLRAPLASEWLVLCPTLVKGEGLYLANDTNRIAGFCYPCRGGWTVAEAVPGGTQALVGLIGRSRTALLCSLAEPSSSAALAARLGVTPTAVNQHLRALHAAGLLDSARSGRYVLYRRSALGDALVEATAAA